MSGRWGCRPLVGMGVMEVHGFEVLSPNRVTGCLPGTPRSIDRSIQFVPVRTYLDSNSLIVRPRLAVMDKLCSRTLKRSRQG